MLFREPLAQKWTPTQLQNRAAVRGPQAGSPLGVVEATGSDSFSLKRCEIQSFSGRVVARLGPGRYEAVNKLEGSLDSRKPPNYRAASGSDRILDSTDSEEVILHQCSPAMSLTSRFRVLYLAPISV